MPLVQDNPDLGSISHLPEPEAPPPAPSMGETVGAAFRTNNIGVSLYDTLQKPPPEKSVPGFDPLSSVPAGYEKYADRFIDSSSPEDNQYIKNKIDSEQRDQEIIKRSGKLGFVASMAAGLTDPLTLASMAIPFGGETRLAQAGRMAMINAGTTALQEGIEHELSPTRSIKDSMSNIGASAVLGGILGGALRPAIPAGRAATLTRDLHTELRPGGGESVLGPTERSAMDHALPSDLPDLFESSATTEHVKAMGAPAQSEGTSYKPIQPGDNLGAYTVGNGKIPQEDMDSVAPYLKEGHILEPGIQEVPLSEFAKSRPPNLSRDWMSEGYRAQEDRKLSDLVEKIKESKRVDPLIVVRNAEGASVLEGGHRLDAAYQIDGAKSVPAMVVREPGLQVPTNDLAAPQEAVTAEAHINPNAESDAGAAQARNASLDDLRIAKGAQSLAEGFVGNRAPGLRVLQSPSLEARKLAMDLSNVPEKVEGNYRGMASAQPVERELWKYEGVNWQGLQARGEAFKTYRERLAGSGEDPMSRGDFAEEVGKAMRRNDEHDIPEVAQAAKDTRRLIFDPLFQRAQKAGLLPEGVKVQGADSYMMRQFDQQKIRADRPGWMKLLSDHFTGQGVEPAEALDLAHQVDRNIGGSERGTMDFHALDGIVPKSGRLKERTLDIPDRILEPYLNNNIDRLSHSYLRSLAPEVEMTERFGSRDMEDQIGSIQDEYARLQQQALAKGESDQPLIKQLAADLRDLTAMRDRLYGTFGQPKDPGHFAVRSGRMLRSVNALRLLGSAMLSHFPDIGGAIMRYGTPQTFGAIGKVLSNTNLRQLAMREAKRMGAALDMVGNVTAATLGDYGSHSQFAEQRFMRKATSAFTIGTGETPLITMVQSLTSLMAQHDILSAAERLANGAAVSGNRLANLASAGLDRDMLARIAEQGGQFGQRVKGLRFGMSDQWADSAAARAFESAILKEAHGVTLRPGAGDTPLFMSTELGKTLLQFKSFGFAASRIVVNPLLQGLAHGDTNAMQGLFALMFMGAASYITKQTVANQMIEWDNPTRFAAEVLDKSNLMGWMGDVAFPLMAQMGMKNLSRWSDRDPIETLGGPSAGMVGDLFSRRLPARLTANPDGDTEAQDEKPFSRSDLHFMRRMAPGQNLWYLRSHINDLEDAVGNAFDLPGKSNADRHAEQLAKESVQ